MQDLKLTLIRVSIVGTLELLVLCPGALVGAANNAKVGAYYFEGWYHDSPGLIAAFANAELRNDFPEREPIWGGGLWRGDTVAIMEQQIDLAADHGVSFFSFDWYWYGSQAATANDGINSGLKNFMLASNRNRMEFNINIVDAAPTTINSDAEWQQVADMLLPYMTDSQYLRVGGNPLITNFAAAGMTQTNYDYVQQIAAAAGISEVEFAANVAGPSSLYSHVTRYNAVPGWGAGEVAYPYQSLTEYMEGNDTWAPGFWNTESGGGQAYIPTIMAGWDARPWNTPPSWYFNNPELGHSPAAVGAHLQKAIDWIDANPTLATPERLIMIYAWNEFGEGGYIAPTVGDPNGLYLDAIRSVVVGSATGPSSLDTFETGGFTLVADTLVGALSPAVDETPLSSSYFTNGRRLTELQLETGNEIRATLNPDSPNQADDGVTIVIDSNSTGVATVSYLGDAPADLTSGGGNAVEVTLVLAPSSGTLFAYAEDVQTWDYADVLVNGPGTYLFAFDTLDELSNGLDFTQISNFGFGIRGQAAGTTLTYRISDIRVVAVSAAQSTFIPEPATWMLLGIGGLLLNRRACDRRLWHNHGR
jgi:hypothetical protein